MRISTAMLSSSVGTQTTNENELEKTSIVKIFVNLVLDHRIGQSSLLCFFLIGCWANNLLFCILYCKTRLCLGKSFLRIRLTKIFTILVFSNSFSFVVCVPTDDDSLAVEMRI